MVNWFLEWFVFDERVFLLLGIKFGEKVVGFIYIGLIDFLVVEWLCFEFVDKVIWMEG